MRFNRYPHNWRKVSSIIRRLANGRCEWCHEPCEMYELSVHHKGVPYADGRPGDPRDKHDVRRENLSAYCYLCHFRAEMGYTQPLPAWKQHRALNIGVGLVPLRQSNPIHHPFYWQAVQDVHYALLRWAKRSGKSRYDYLITIHPVVVDSFVEDIAA